MEFRRFVTSTTISGFAWEGWSPTGLKARVVVCAMAGKGRWVAQIDCMSQEVAESDRASLTKAEINLGFTNVFVARTREGAMRAASVAYAAIQEMKARAERIAGYPLAKAHAAKAGADFAQAVMSAKGGSHGSLSRDARNGDAARRAYRCHAPFGGYGDEWKEYAAEWNLHYRAARGFPADVAALKARNPVSESRRAAQLRLTVLRDTARTSEDWQLSTWVQNLRNLRAGYRNSFCGASLEWLLTIGVARAEIARRAKVAAQ